MCELYAETDLPERILNEYVHGRTTDSRNGLLLYDTVKTLYEVRCMHYEEFEEWGGGTVFSMIPTLRYEANIVDSPTTSSQMKIILTFLTHMKVF